MTKYSCKKIIKLGNYLLTNPKQDKFEKVLYITNILQNKLLLQKTFQKQEQKTTKNLFLFLIILFEILY